MRKILLFGLLILGAIGIAATAYTYMNMRKTKSFSPEEEVVFNDVKLKIRLFYNRPYKKGREIFGGLVPYDKVWRTGANEATVFSTNQDLNFEGKILKKGKYSLWTIPRQETWTIIFNSEYGQWGINSDGAPNRDQKKDVLTIDAGSVQQEKEFEQFTIAFEKSGTEAEMVLLWDKTLVSVPFSY